MRKQPSFAQMDGNILLKLLCGRHMASAILLLGNKVGDLAPTPKSWRIGLITHAITGGGDRWGKKIAEEEEKCRWWRQEWV